MKSSFTQPALSFESDQSLLRPSKKNSLGLLTKDPNRVETIHESLYMESCWPAWCPQWDYQTERDYFRVLENGYEYNKSFVSPTFMKFISLNTICCFHLNSAVTYCFESGWCGCIPPNCCCLSSDKVTKVYFDRGVFDRQMCCFNDIGGITAYTGPPTVYSGPSQYICCCIDCPEWANNLLEGNIPYLCGEKISVRPCTDFLGCRLEANLICNFCGLCGVKDGEPICVSDIPGGSCLKPGTSAIVADTMNKAYSSWSDRITRI